LYAGKLGIPDLGPAPDPETIIVVVEPWRPATPEELEKLKKRALEAAVQEARKTTATRTVVDYERNPAIKKFVKARAAGVCEICHKPAEHYTTHGTPILDTHHIIQVSLGGPDDPSYVVAVHPNCHAAAHRSAQSVAINQEALDYVRSL
jgi:5-methylcytosine-specific restriction protein A